MSMSAVMVAPMGLAGPSERQIIYHELSLVRLKTFVSLINQHLRGSLIRQIGSAVWAPSRGPGPSSRSPPEEGHDHADGSHRSDAICASARDDRRGGCAPCRAVCRSLAAPPRRRGAGGPRRSHGGPSPPLLGG